MRRATGGRSTIQRGMALLGILALVALAMPVSSPKSARAQEPAAKEGIRWGTDARPGELLVKFRDDVPWDERGAILSGSGAGGLRTLRGFGAGLVSVEPEKAEAVLDELKSDPRVAYAEPNWYVHSMDTPRYPDDPQFSNIWGLDNQGQMVDGVTGSVDADIDAPEAWEVTTGSRDVVVAIVDTGIDFTQPDLGGGLQPNPLLWINPGEDCPGCRFDEVDNDGNGYVDDWRGWDFANDDNNPHDDNGHGTHIAGTIGALPNNGIGGTGVNWQVSLVGLKFLGAEGGGAISDAIEALNYAAMMGFQITNNSWGSLFSSQALYDAIAAVDQQGVLVVAAAGNDGIDTDAIGSYPGAYDLPNIISVAASDSNDALASFSNWGKGTVDLSAPGTDIYSTWNTSLGNAYRYLNGTSMSTGFVTGAVALARAQFPNATQLGLKALLLNTVDPVGALQGNAASGGRLNVNRAVRCNDPLVWVESPEPGFAIAAGEEVNVRLIASYCADTAMAGLTVNAKVNGADLALTARGDGLYEGTFTPQGIGEVQLAASVEGGSGTGRATLTGRTLRDYGYQNVAHEWVDATTGGTDAAIVEDDGVAAVDLPFPFIFYEEQYSRVQISGNGYVVFGDGAASAYQNFSIPSRTYPNGFAAPFWDDLNLAGGGSVWYRTVGEAPNRRFVVAWINVPHYNKVGDATFEVILHEGSNAVEFQYLDLDFGTADYNDGRSATVGVEHWGGRLGSEFAHEDVLLRRYTGQMGLMFSAFAPEDPRIETFSLETANVGEEYSAQLEATGGSEPYTWLVVDGELPGGLALDPATGAIGGTPEESGSFTFTVQLSDAAQPARSARQRLSLLSVRGYVMADLDFAWVDASQGGTAVPIAEDDSFVPLNLPFSFTFYDEEFTHIQVGSNGYITFGDQEARRFSNAPIPDANTPNGYAAPFWDDLSPQLGGGVWTTTVGEAPNRQLVIMWKDTPHYKETGAATFEVILHEGSNAIEFQYLDTSFEFSVYDHGKAATVGIENPAGSAGRQFSYNLEGALLPYTGLKGIRFTPLALPDAPPAITTLPGETAIINQPYTYQAAASGPNVTWSLPEAPEGMAIDPQSGLVTWTPATLGTFDVSVQASNNVGQDIQEFTLTVQAGPTQEATLSVADGWDAQAGSTLGAAGTLPSVQTSDDTWLAVPFGSWTSFSFSNSLPAGATLQSVVIVAEHHEEYGTPDGSIVWEVGGGTLQEPAMRGSTLPEIFTSQAGDKLVEWDISEWVTTYEELAAMTFVIRNNSAEDQALVDHLSVLVHYVVPAP